MIGLLVRKLHYFLALLIFCSALSRAQNTQKKAPASNNFITWNNMDYADVSVTLGRFLPFGVVGVRDNYPMWGLNFAHPTVLGSLEWDFYSLRGEGVILYNGGLGLRWDFGVFNAIDGFFGFAANVFHYKRLRTTRRTFPFYTSGGWALKWGVFQPITDDFRLRADFKFNSGPGRTLYTGIGFNVKF